MAKSLKCVREPDSLDVLEQILEEEERAKRHETLFTDDQEQWFRSAVILISTTILIALIWKLWLG